MSGTVTQHHFTDLSTMASIPTLLRRFGHWRDVLARAGLGERYGGRTVSLKLKRHAARTTDLVEEFLIGVDARPRHAVDSTDYLHAEGGAQTPVLIIGRRMRRGLTRGLASPANSSPPGRASGRSFSQDGRRILAVVATRVLIVVSMR